MATWFTDDVEAIKMVTIALRIDAFAQPVLAIGLVLTGALQAASDTKKSNVQYSYRNVVNTNSWYLLIGNLF